MGKPVTFWKLECSSIMPTIERIRATLSITPAILGSSSPIWTPGSRVAIGLNSPRMPTGASGLRSKVSWCAWPPDRYTMITDLWDDREDFEDAPPVPSDSACNKAGRFSPPIPRPPILRNDRRDNPSQ